MPARKDRTILLTVLFLVICLGFAVAVFGPKALPHTQSRPLASAPAEDINFRQYLGCDDSRYSLERPRWNRCKDI